MPAAVSVPCMPPLAPVLQQHEITQAEFARGMGLSTAAACRLVKHGLLPRAAPATCAAAPWTGSRHAACPSRPSNKLTPASCSPPRSPLKPSNQPKPQRRNRC